MQANAVLLALGGGSWAKLGSDGAWQPWLDLFSERGYAVSAPGWPGDSDTVAATRDNADSLNDVGIQEIVDHYAALIGLLETRGVDFAYPRVQFYRNGQRPDEGFQIGSDPPMHGQFTHSVFRASILKRAMPAWGTHPVDWSLCQAWMQAGASWAMLPDVTFSHRADR